MQKSRLAWATVGLVGTGVLLSPLAMAATSAPVAAEDLTLVEENGAAVTAVASADPQPLSRHHGGYYGGHGGYYGGHGGYYGGHRR